MTSEIRRITTPYAPADLAAWLDVWALRREKMIELLDLKSARRARGFAARCRRLSACEARYRDQIWMADWMALRLEVAGFLSARRESMTMRAVGGRRFA